MSTPNLPHDENPYAAPRSGVSEVAAAQSAPSPHPPVGLLITRTVDTTGKALAPVLAIFFLAYLPLEIASVAVADWLEGIMPILVSSILNFGLLIIVDLLVMSAVIVTVVAAVLPTIRGQTATFRGALSVALSMYWQVVLARLLITVASFSLILLVLPGIYLLTRWVFIEPYLVDRKATALEAFELSWERTRNAFWPVFGRLFVGILPMLGLAATLVATGGLNEDTGAIQEIVSNMTLGAAGCLFKIYLCVYYVELQKRSATDLQGESTHEQTTLPPLKRPDLE